MSNETILKDDSGEILMVTSLVDSAHWNKTLLFQKLYSGL